MVYSTNATYYSTGGSVWSTWNSDSTSSATTADPRNLWNSAPHETYTTAGSSNYNSTVTWRRWVADDTRTCPYTSSTYVTPARELSRMEKKEERNRIRRRKEEKRRLEALEMEKKAAEQRAKDLLLDLIGEKELAIYKETGRLFVKGRQFDYIIQKTGYIKRIGKDKITDLCVHLDNRYKFPETDNVVALKLALESDEEGILKIANEHGSYGLSEKPRKAACM